MPPPVEEDENNTEDIPFRKAPAAAKGAAADDDEEEEDDDEEGEEYVVEKILAHQWDPDDKCIKYRVQWEGYPKKDDHTWEPKENFEGALEILHKYWEKIGGEPGKPEKGSKKRKHSEGASAAKDTPEPKSKAGRKKKRWNPTGDPDLDDALEDAESPTFPRPGSVAHKEFKTPAGSWEDHILHIDTIEEILDPETGVHERMAYVTWADKERKKTRHPLEVLNKKCPQKMLAYYEQHLVFKRNQDDAANGGLDGAADDEPIGDVEGLGNDAADEAVDIAGEL